MTVAFQPKYKVQIGEVVIEHLDVKFSIERSLRKEPNTCDLLVWNLNDNNRANIALADDLAVRIDAGHTDHIGTIFQAKVRKRHSTWVRPDWITTIEAGDGERAMQQSRINKSYAKGTKLETVLKDVAESMGIGLGNLKKRLSEGVSLADIADEFTNGITVSGNSYKELQQLANSADMQVSIQNEVLQILRKGAALSDFSVKLNHNTGMIGSPAIGEKGVLEVRSLLNPDIVPGRQIELESVSANGRFVAYKCVYTGDLSSDEWYVDVEAIEL